ncbi:MAG TPA: hypothetical protein VH436_15440 [Vicinamibacterales bacterium]
MIKHIRQVATAPPPPLNEEWLNLAGGVEVELTSEDPDSPIEGALLLNHTTGWRASTAGPQTITLVWAHPVSLRRIRLVFEEPSQARTQEFVVRASTSDGSREIVRQQFNFSPSMTSRECEDYVTNLAGVTRLELAIIPAIDNAEAIATLKEWRVG